MRAASPPASAADILEATNNRRNNRPGIKRSMMAKQSSLDGDDLDLEVEADGGEGECADPDEGDEDFVDATEGSGSGGGFDRDSPRPGTPIVERSN